MPVVYDIETYPNAFTLIALGCDSDVAACWEISDRRDDRESLLAWLYYLHQNQIEMVGFNNVGFDYPVIHHLMNDPTATAADLYAKAISIIQGDRFAHTIWPSDRYIPQIDLQLIHHMEYNSAKATSLKALQFNMRSESVEDLPIPPGTVLTSDQIDVLRAYNMHDVTETKAFYKHSLPAIEFRRQITARYGKDFMNHNDVKIGKDFTVMRIDEVAPGRTKGSTPRDKIVLSDIIFPYIQFTHPELQRILTWFKSQTITETKGAIRAEASINGLEIVFALGGAHASIERSHIHSDDTHMIVDLDVGGYYPSLSVANRIYPEHLGEVFCDVFAQIREERKQYTKGSPENQALKLCGNGTFGNSNSPYSPFYDPQFTMATTVNGQLLLCMMIDRLLGTMPDMQIIQVNTDGFTIRIPRAYDWLLTEAVAWWEGLTKLDLERVNYSEMYIRDVNNYLAVDTDGKVKRKGAYESAQPGDRVPLGWHQDCSALVIPKAAEAHILRGEDIETFIRNHLDPFDFMIRAKVPRNSRLMWGDEQVQGTTRYYVALDGAPLTKVSPPVEGGVLGHYKRARGVSLADYNAWHKAWGNTWNPEVHTKNKSKHKDRVTGICAGWNVGICNRAADFERGNVAYEWYVAEAKKLVDS